MFERFTPPPARQSVVLAQDEARALGHAYIGTEHLLLGLIREGEGLAARTLAELGVVLPAARERVRVEIGIGERRPAGHIPFTPRAKRALQHAGDDAAAMREAYVGTEHVLLGVLDEEEGLAAKVLRDLGTPADAARRQLAAALGSPLPARRRRRLSRRFGLVACTALIALGLAALLGWSASRR